MPSRHQLFAVFGVLPLFVAGSAAAREISGTITSTLTVTGVTISTTCMAGIFISGGSENHLIGNEAVRNGHIASPCGGI